MLRIAVPNKGSLSETAVEMLREAGYATRRDPKELIVADPRNNVEFFYLRPRDIATYVGSGALDVGITGRDLLLDSESPAIEIDELDFGASTFRFAGPMGRFAELKDLAGLRVATSYDALVRDFLASHNSADGPGQASFLTFAELRSALLCAAALARPQPHDGRRRGCCCAA